MTRLSVDQWAIGIAQICAQRSTCLRRNAGCVLLNARNEILAVGYNGTPRGTPHCAEGFPCPGAEAESGTRLDDCLSTHAEINALLQCHTIWDIETCVVTVSPCVHCTRALMNTSCQNILFLEEYAHTAAKDEWLGPVRRWRELRETLGDAAPRPPVRQWIHYIGDL